MNIAQELFPEEYEQAIKRGEEKARKQMAENMLRDGEPIEKYTGISDYTEWRRTQDLNPEEMHEWFKEHPERPGKARVI